MNTYKTLSKKIMKKFLVILLIILGVLLTAVIAIPMFFKDDIKKAIDEAVAESVDADVYFDSDHFGLSLFRNFPNLTVSLNEFGVVGKAPFLGDTLAAIGSFRAVVNLTSLIRGDQIVVNKISLIRPIINVLVLEDGTANYNIFKESEEMDTTQVDEASEPASFSVGIRQWEIIDGSLSYDDRGLPIKIMIEGLKHKGGGDFNQDVFDLSTKTIVGDFSLNFDGVNYMTHKELDIDMTLNMNLPEAKYTFQENAVRVNDFSFGIDGYVAMLDTTGVMMDISFASADNSFKSILSLVPGVYTEEFKELEAKGSLKFSGLAKGAYKYDGSEIPAFKLESTIKDGMVHYPDLPASIKDIQMDILAQNSSGVMEETEIDLRKFAMKLGNNPIEGNFQMKRLDKPKIKSKLFAKLNLADINEIFPIEGITLKGDYNLDANIDGVYDSIAHIIPKFDVKMALNNGSIKLDTIPIPIEDIYFKASVLNKSGKMTETFAKVHTIGAKVDGELIEGQMAFSNLDNYTWDIWVKGNVDVAKITKTFPIEGMSLTGKVIGEIQTAGQMSYVEKKQYDKLPTSGKLTVDNFYLSGEILPQGLNISHSVLVFDPAKISLEQLDGKVGQSTFNMKGQLQNYMAFFLRKETIKGSLKFNSPKFDANEWIPEESTEEVETSSDTAAIDPVIIPKNIDFSINANIDEVIYTNLTMKNAKGNLTARGGKLIFGGFQFDCLDGQFELDGNYNTSVPKKPSYDMKFSVTNLSIREAYKNFKTVKKMAPMAKNMSGRFSANFALDGDIGAGMIPIYETMNGKGVIKTQDVGLKDSKLIEAITKITKLSNSKDAKIKDQTIQAEVINGRVYYEPINLSLGSIKAVISGSNGVDGSLDFVSDVTVPTGNVGQSINSALSSFGLGDKIAPSTVNIPIKIGGTFDKPKCSIRSKKGGTSSKPTAPKEEEEASNKSQEEQRRKQETAKKLEREAKEKAEKELERIKEAEKKRLKEKAIKELRKFF